MSTPWMPAAVFASVSGYSRPLPPLLVSMNGGRFSENMSPECITRSAGNTTSVSPLVCAGPKW